MKTAIVTGCAGEIGSAICEVFQENGLSVVGIDKVAAYSGVETYHSCDLSDTKQIERTLSDIRSSGSRIDVLVNNAGIYQPKKFFDLTVEDFDLTMDINTRSVFVVSQLVARWMVEDGLGGSIINISSISGRLGSPIIPYATSKAAVIGLTKAMSMALASQNIRVNSIAPGVIDTGMIKGVAPEQMARQMSNIPMGRLGLAREIASVAMFLASQASSYMSGSTLDVNGGWPC